MNKGNDTNCQAHKDDGDAAAAAVTAGRRFGGADVSDRFGGSSSRPFCHASTFSQSQAFIEHRRQREQALYKPDICDTEHLT